MCVTTLLLCSGSPSCISSFQFLWAWTHYEFHKRFSSCGHERMINFIHDVSCAHCLLGGTIIRYGGNWLVPNHKTNTYTSVNRDRDSRNSDWFWKIRRRDKIRCVSKWSSSSPRHYGDVIMSTMTSQITCHSTVCSYVCSGADQR